MASGHYRPVSEENVKTGAGEISMSEKKARGCD
jgi:hypothetical protein